MSPIENAASADSSPNIEHQYVADTGYDLPLPENKKFYPALDGLRALAVLMVFWQHYGEARPTLNWGWAGVDTFFVLSGFLITGILYDTRNAPRRFRTFYARRTLRIFPLYYAVLLIGFALWPVFHWIWHPAVLLWPLYLGNFSRFIWVADVASHTGVVDHLVSTQKPFAFLIGHFWSLCVEEQFYLVWPFVVFFVQDRIRLRNICLIASVVCLAARIVCVFTLPQPLLDAEILYRLTPLRADALLLGGAVALMLRGPEAAWLQRAVKPLFFCFVAGFALFEFFFHLATHQFYKPVAAAPVLDTLGYTLIDLFAAVLILLALQPQGPFFRALTLKPLRKLGQVSYGFYVFHDIPHILYRAIGLQLQRGTARFTLGIWTAIVALLFTIPLSFLSFRYFETPFLRLKKRFSY